MAGPANHDRRRDSTTSVVKIDREPFFPGPQIRGPRRNDTGQEPRTEPGYPSLGVAFGVRIQPHRGVYCTGDPLPSTSQALDVGVQLSDVLPQLVAMCSMSFQIVRSAVQLLMLALQVLTGANQSLMLVFESVVHTETPGAELRRAAFACD